MKTLMQVTSPREIKYGSKSYAYQITHRFHRILVIHQRKSRNFRMKGLYSVTVRYYHVCPDGRVWRDSNYFAPVGAFPTELTAFLKVVQLVVERGSGTKDQWESFFKNRLGIKSRKEKTDDYDSYDSDR